MEMPQFVEKQVTERMATGRYASVEEVFRKAFEALEDSEIDEDELRAELQEAADQLDRGEGIPAEEVFKLLRERAEKYQ